MDIDEKYLKGSSDDSESDFQLDTNFYFALRDKISANLGRVSKDERLERIKENVKLWNMTYGDEKLTLPKWIANSIETNIQSKDHFLYIRDDTIRESDDVAKAVAKRFVEKGLASVNSLEILSEDELLGMYSIYSGDGSGLKRLLSKKTIVISGVGSTRGNIGSGGKKTWNALIQNAHRRRRNLIISSCMSYKDFLFDKLDQSESRYGNFFEVLDKKQRA